MSTRTGGRPPLPKWDVIVVGAGVSGLAAAGEMGRAGLKVFVVEASERVGGRILSVKSAGWPRGIELGAEFIHGGNTTLKKTLKKGRISTRSIDAKVWWHDQTTGVLASIPDYWERIGRIADQIPRRNLGWSFHKFLQHRRGHFPAGDSHLADFYVGGFDAAPTHRIAAHPLRADRAGAGSDDRKIKGHYESVVHELVRAAKAAGTKIQLKSPITQIAWHSGKVEVSLAKSGRRAPATLPAQAVVVTLPLGVLQSGQVKFSPALPDKQKVIARMGWGQAVRISLRFKRGFWPAPFMPKAMAAFGGRDFGFINSPGQPLPVWWALHALIPILTGWAGGLSAEPLSRKPPAQVLKAAVQSLAEIFGTSRPVIRNWLEDWACHQWGTDPLTLGAYSYPMAGYEDDGARLAKPVDGTLFFAGEATAEEFGTVHGAIESGERAGREVIKVLADVK